MSLLNHTLALCKEYGIMPNKLLGQNFLINELVIEDIIDEATKIKANIPNVLEIGGGFGFLTNRLLDIFDKTFVIEKDPNLFKGLKKIEAIEMGRMKVVLDDALNIDVYEKDLLNSIKNYFNNEDYVVVANIPYSITSHLIRTLLELSYKPKKIVLMVQKEVAYRVCSEKGDSNMLSISAQFYSNPEILFNVSKNSFYPAPKIDSSIIYFDIKEENPLKIKDQKEIDQFFKFVKNCFLNRRKMLYFNLSSIYRVDREVVKGFLSGNGINEKTRAQDLNINDFINLWYNFRDLRK